jgi:hypothetical protein
MVEMGATINTIKSESDKTMDVTNILKDAVAAFRI